MLKKFQSYTATYQNIVFVSLSEFTLTMDTDIMDVLVLVGLLAEVRSRKGLEAVLRQFINQSRCLTMSMEEKKTNEVIIQTV
jgi:hypothetical protein